MKKWNREWEEIRRRIHRTMEENEMNRVYNKIIYLHVGTPKTGTSAIQKFLADNAPKLKTYGYDYSTLPYEYERNVRKERNAHFMFEKVHFENGDIDFEESEKRKQIGFQLIEKGLKEGNNVILTDESFWNGMRGKNWKKFDELVQFAKEHNAQVKVIVYLRCQEQFIYSWWRQNVKTGKTTVDWETFLSDIPKRLVLNYAMQLKHFAQYIGRENMIVRRYGTEYFVGGNIFSDFLSSIGIFDMGDFFIRQDRVNKSIGDNFAEIKRVLCLLSEEDRECTSETSFYFEKIAVQCTEMSRNAVKYSMYSQQELEQIWQRFEKSNEAVRKLYFPKEQELFIKHPVKHPKWTKDNPQMIEDMILYFGQVSIIQKQENDYLKNQLVELNSKIEQNEKKLKTVKQNHPQFSKGEEKALKILLFPVKKVWRWIKRLKNSLQKCD